MNKYTLLDMQKPAKKKKNNGYCISKEYKKEGKNE